MNNENKKIFFHTDYCLKYIILKKKYGNLECSVCYNEVNIDNIVILDCYHYNCYNCIKKYILTMNIPIYINCFLCRKQQVKIFLSNENKKDIVKSVFNKANMQLDYYDRCCGFNIMKKQFFYSIICSYSILIFFFMISNFYHNPNMLQKL